jgi:hypothetical protein
LVDKISRLPCGKRLVRQEARLSRPPGSSNQNKKSPQTTNLSAASIGVKRKNKNDSNSRAPKETEEFCSLNQIMVRIIANNSGGNNTDCPPAVKLRGRQRHPFLKLCDILVVKQLVFLKSPRYNSAPFRAVG